LIAVLLLLYHLQKLLTLAYEFSLDLCLGHDVSPVLAHQVVPYRYRLVRRGRR